MKFAFLIMGNYDSAQDRVVLRGGAAQMIGVGNIDEACRVAKELYAEGVGCIELCGAFGPAGAKKIIDATENKLPIGYITHLPEQDDVYKAAFAK